LSLYTRPLDMKIHTGLNLIIGGNGIGKTTLINTILFGLVGNATYQRLDGLEREIPLINEDYFHGRLDPEDQELAQVSVTFGIGKDEFAITRALFRPQILRLEHTPGGTHTKRTIKGSPTHLEKQYRKLLESLLGLRRFEDFVFIIANLLIFDENRRTLAWDPEVQNRIVRLLSVPPPLDEAFSRYSRLVTQNDTKGRHKSEDRKRIRRAIQNWTEAKDEKKDKPHEAEKERQAIEKRLNELDREIERVEGELEDNRFRVSSEIGVLKELNARADDIELKRAPLFEKQTDLESEFYGSIYKSVPAAYVLLLQALVKQGLCEFCHTQGKQLRALGRELKAGGLCIVCRSPIDYTRSLETRDNAPLVDEINSIRETVEQLNAEMTVCAAAQATAKSTISVIHETLVEKSRIIRNLDTERFELRTRYAALGADIGEGELDPWLQQQNRAIEKLDEEIEDLYRKRDDAKAKLNEVNEKIVKTLHNVNEKLTPLFSDYASKFLGTNCELVITQKTRQGKPVAYMFPRFLDKERRSMTQVSESQRFFIDQAFRMALISWFAQSNSGRTFCIVETPEGSLDLAYEVNVAKMYLEFAKQGHSIIATSNLNSSGFLVELFKHLGSHPRQRVLDLLAYGRLTSVQNDKKPDFNKSLNRLKLPPL
jgi:DNA repair exonuclease SbcCD ATPase subunit